MRTASAAVALVLSLLPVRPAPAQQAVHGCVSARNRRIHAIGVVQPQCRPTETPISWSVVGPPGPQGDPGVCACATTTTTSTSTSATNTTAPTTTIPTPGVCSSTGAQCYADADCGVPGVCYGPDECWRYTRC